MIKSCGKCGFENPQAEASPTASCPKCGAVYAKVEAEAARKAAKAAEDAAEAETKVKAAQEYEARLAEAKARAAENERLTAEQSAMRAERSALRQCVCLACGTVGKPKKNVKGSFAVELLLWGGGLLLCLSIIGLHLGLTLLLIAFLYSIWRAFSRRARICASCRSEQIIPADSPNGRAELAKQGLIRNP